MRRGFRSFVLAAGAAALLSGQAVASTAPASLDPLVSLSVLGTTQSRAAVCAGAAAAATAAVAAQAPAPGCLLPVTTPAPVPPVSQAVPPPAPGSGIGIWPLLLGLAAVVGLAALLLSGDDGDGDATPVSP